ncbi:MAG: hypothetical protein ABFD82_23540 [Syntrophaceae bacterium]
MLKNNGESENEIGEIKEDLTKLRQNLSVLRLLPSLTREIQLSVDETCGVAWLLDNCINITNALSDKIGRLIG